MVFRIIKRQSQNVNCSRQVLNNNIVYLAMNEDIHLFLKCEVVVNLLMLLKRMDECCERIQRKQRCLT